MLNANEVELLIFDLDGTILSTTRPVYECVKRAFAKLGLPLTFTANEMEKYFGTYSGEFYQAITPEESGMQWEEMRTYIRKEHAAAFAEYAEVFPGVKETLQTLRDRDYRLALHSNSGKEYFHSTISILGIGDYFDYAECVHENNLTKAELVWKIRSKFGNVETAVIGDRIHDIESARENNCLSIGALYGYGDKEPEQADITISSFPELLNIFDRKLPLFEDILAAIQTKKQKDRAFIVGITGIDCSGKTAFAESLDRFLGSRGFNTLLLHLDDFHNPTEYRYSGDDQADSYFNKSFNIQKIVNELLIPVRRDKTFTKRLLLLNLETDKYDIEKEYTVNPDTIVIFEGVFLLRKEFTPYIDYRVFLDISFDECIRRAWARDSEDFIQRYGDREEVYNRYESKYLPAQRKYLAEYTPMDTADLIIDNTDWERPKITDLPLKNK